MNVLRVADLVNSHEAGASGAMIRGGTALAPLGVTVDYIFRENLGQSPTSAPLRRLIVPSLVVRAVLRLLRQGLRYDVVEIQEPIAAGYCAARELLDLPPCVVFAHGLQARLWKAQLNRWRKIGHSMSMKDRLAMPLTLLPQAQFALRRADQVIVPTWEDAEYLERTVRVDPDRICRVDNGATIVGGERLPPTLPTKMLFFGSWIDRKGVRELVDAITVLHRSGLSFQLTVAGTGSADPAISGFPADVLAKVDVRPHVSRTELPGLLNHHDILIGSSWFEGMPLAVLEAAGAGMALVLTDISGHRQILRGAGEKARDSAILIPPHDAEALADALSSLCLDADRVVRLQNGARLLASTLTWERTAEQLKCAYENAVTSRRPQSRLVRSVAGRASRRRISTHADI